MPSATEGARETFQSFLKEGELRLPYCTACTRFIYPPGRRPPGCQHQPREWRSISGRGHVYAATVARHRPEDGGDRSIVVVELAEGPRMVSTIVGMEADQVRIGAAVRAVIQSAGSSPYIAFQTTDGDRS